ncbi:glycosyltransferase family 39 protein [Clostridium lundense]|uniref:glycosyltransferase family 39 protein n=1 Tax=Clostridium lundense TaxID=319475 RepID=UPI000483A7EE|nr:glycosyltransferase family 39 protein [Clostridium lundense]
MLTKINYNVEKKSNKYYLIIGVIGLILSIVWCSIVSPKLFSDFEYYYNLAVDIANGKPWGDTYTSVGYPIALGFLFKIFGASTLVAKIFNIVLTVISYYLVYSILDKLEISEISKKVIFTMFVVFPISIYYNNLVATEIIFSTMVLLVTNVYLSDIKYKYIILGVLIGMNTIVKPFFMCICFGFFLVDSITSKKIIKSLVNSLIAFIVAAIVIAPWCYRNTKLTGELTFVSNNGGIVLYINNNSQNNVGRWMPAEDVENSIVKTEEYINANMTKRNKMLSKAAKQWIRENPKHFMELGFLRLVNTYGTAGDSYYTTYESGLNDSQKNIIYSIANKAKQIVFYPGILFILLYSVYILINLIKRSTENINKFMLYCCVIFYMFTCVYFITEGQARYSFPVIFPLIYCFNYLLNILIRKVKELL